MRTTFQEGANEEDIQIPLSNNIDNINNNTKKNGCTYYIGIYSLAVVVVLSQVFAATLSQQIQVTYEYNKPWFLVIVKIVNFLDHN